MDPDDVREIEVEVIPPGGKLPPPPRASASADREAARVDDPFIALISKLMDSAFVIPGTGIRFGFDPLIGLIPGIGDTASAVTSLVLIWKSARYGLPRIVLARMALNVLINAAIGAIPGIGDAFSIFFRSNAKNYELLRKHAHTPGASTKPDWFFVALLLGVTLFALVSVFLAAVAWFQILRSLLGWH